MKKFILTFATGFVLALMGYSVFRSAKEFIIVIVWSGIVYCLSDKEI